MSRSRKKKKNLQHVKREALVKQAWKGAEEQSVKGLEVLIKTLSNMLETGGLWRVCRGDESWASERKVRV